MVEYTYDAWGNLLSVTGSLANTLGADNPLRYRGYVYDTQTRLYYLQSRYYDPEVGRFLNADALVSTGQGVLGNNMFSYCQNNPSNYSDPAGMCRQCLESNCSSKITASAFGICSGGGGASGATIALGAVVAMCLYVVASYADELEEAIKTKLQQSLAVALKREYKSEHETHHIAAKKSPNAAAAAAILNELLDHGVENSLNKVVLKTSVHRRIHTTHYYSLVNHLIIEAYTKANGNKQQQYSNVVAALKGVRKFLETLNAYSIN